MASVAAVSFTQGGAVSSFASDKRRDATKAAPGDCLRSVEERSRWLRFLLWFVAGIGLAAAGGAIAVKVGNDAAGILVGVTIFGGTILGALLMDRKQ